MSKKNKKQIVEYYSRNKVVDTYDNRRFRGPGGTRIDQTEVDGVIKAFEELDLKKAAVLDLGAGRGRLSIPLKKEGYKVFCLDSSPDMVKVLGKSFPKDHLLTQSAFEPIKLRRTVKAAGALRFFDHFSLADQKKILINVKKKLSKDGVFVFACLNSQSLESRLSKFFPYGRYNYFYSDADYRKMFKSAQFNVYARRSCFFFPRGIFLYSQRIPGIFSIFNALDYFLVKFFPQSGAYFVYTLRRK